MSPEHVILRDLIQPQPPVVMRPTSFFVAWYGVLALVYEGFPQPLMHIKRGLEERMPNLVKENPGSTWPKTTLGALNEGVRLTLGELEVLETICRRWSARLRGTAVTVPHISAVLFACRSLERRLATHRFRLAGTPHAQRNAVEVQHQAYVRGILSYCTAPSLARYLPDVQRPGHRIGHYRADHREATLIHDLDVPDPDYIKGFIAEVDDALPGYYAWFDPSCRHITLRTLGRTDRFR
ncbi:MAG: hypothetical protein AAF730_07690 [Bacteroidota bacterium]